jgi:hypothetical protein
MAMSIIEELMSWSAIAKTGYDPLTGGKLHEHTHDHGAVAARAMQRAQRMSESDKQFADVFVSEFVKGREPHAAAAVAFARARPAEVEHEIRIYCQERGQDVNDYSVYANAMTAALDRLSKKLFPGDLDDSERLADAAERLCVERGENPDNYFDFSRALIEISKTKAEVK